MKKIDEQKLLSEYNVVWHTPSEDSSGSMPLGNGDVALNVWVEAGGDLLFYIAKSDAWSGEGRLIKIGRVRLTLEPNSFERGRPFRQELVLCDGEIRIEAWPNVKIRIWVDAYKPLIHLEIDSDEPLQATAKTEIWRTEVRALQKPQEEHSAYGLQGTEAPVLVQPDTLFSGEPDRVVWCHRNEDSIYASTLEHQQLAGWLDQAPDPLLHRTFGAVMTGIGMKSIDSTKLCTTAPRKKIRLQVACHTAQTATLDEWKQEALQIRSEKLAAELGAHREWWRSFWQRSYIHARGCPEALLVSRGYALQRFMTACAGRGNFPVKFNGSLFTVDAREPDWRHFCNPTNPQPVPGAPDMGAGQTFDADFRRWGGPYWHQNTRLPYWAMLAAGDFDMMPVFFRLYLNALPFAEYRTHQYFGHEGAYFAETMYFWGAYANSDYDYERTAETLGPLCANPYIRHHFQGAIEVLLTMLHFMSYGGELDEAELLRYADAVLTFYDQHYQRDAEGKLWIEPAQSLETYMDAVNPLPEIAGLQCVLDRLLRMPTLDTARCKRWRKLRAAIPEIPLVEENSQRYLAPAQQFGASKNVENPELYAVFPYEQFTVGRPDLDMARCSFGRRVNTIMGGWSQDGIQAAMLGLTGLAEASLIQSFIGKHTASRFTAFWGPSYDWIPDGDNGATGMLTMQRMVLQPVDGTLHLLPAWPKDWEVHFKLHAPDTNVVQGSYLPGRDLEISQEAANGILAPLVDCIRSRNENYP